MGSSQDDQDGLGPYRDKRAEAASPEPFGAGAAAIPPGVFVVQKHAASRLHYDLRLEIDGRLRSWAIPKGFSFDPDVQRLAMAVEDHPLDYVDFEGVIPDGYGAGNMIVWDRGQWRPLEPVREGLAKGKILFALDGYKLRGAWTLFEAGGRNRGANEWLLMKKPDGFAHQPPPAETSILSGLTVEALSKPRALANTLQAELSDASQTRVNLKRLSPMLAEVRATPFDDPEWLFELKYDGFRLMAGRDGGQVHLRYRSGRDATRAFPELGTTLAALPFERFVIDGEVAVVDAAGKPVFNRLQKRVQLERDRDLERARWVHPATYFVFDLLELEGRDLRGLPLERRKAILKRILPEAGPVRYADHVDTAGTAFFDLVAKQELEGIMAKRRAAPYREGRSEDWLKIRSETTEAFAVIGFTTPKGSRTGFGGLHLARPVDGAWRYIGRVGSGFSAALLEDLSRRFERHVRDAPVCEVPKADRSSVWLEPEVVVEVTYLLETADGVIRQSRLRSVREESAAALLAAGDLEPLEGPERAAGPALVISNPSKLFFPEDGITKADLLAYHEKVALFMLPYLQDRPIALHRFPDGIHGKSFFQKHAPDFVPDWVRTERVRSESKDSEREQFVVADLRCLGYLINLGCIPIHAWTARIDHLERPDWLVLDFDPKGAPLERVVELAFEARQLLEACGLIPLVKTSGSSGLHVLAPMGAKYVHDQVRTLALLLAKLLVAKRPDLATIDRSLDKRDGRIYIDYVQNGRGRLLAAPYTVRERPGAPVSTPLEWDELSSELRMTDWSIRTVPERLQARETCPLARVLGHGPDLAAVLERLAGLPPGG